MFSQGVLTHIVIFAETIQSYDHLVFPNMQVDLAPQRAAFSVKTFLWFVNCIVAEPTWLPKQDQTIIYY